MPYKSKRQIRFFYAKEARGELPRGTSKRWAGHTRSIKALPERVRKKKRKQLGKKLVSVLRRA